MQTILFHETIFGPIHSRRLGTSLGVNLMPRDGKICSFDCLYCEAGFNAQGPGKAGLPSREEVARLLADKLSAMSAEGAQLDVITFSGNGEPTLHPDFEGIIDDVIALRDRYYPQARVSVLSNSTMLPSDSVVRALRRVDNNIVKLDSALTSTIHRLDRPGKKSLTADELIRLIEPFGSQCIVQTMMLRGSVDGAPIDNTTDDEVAALIEAYKRIRPGEVMLYSIDRPTPQRTLEKIPIEELRAIGERISREAGVKVQVN